MIWQEIIEEQKLHNIHQLRRLNGEAAKHLIEQEKRFELLSLGITQLPPDVAKELAKYKGEKLFLNCVTSLPVDSAKTIATFKGMKLMLYGVKELSLPVLGRLASYKGSVSFAGIENISLNEKERRRGEMVFGNLEFNKLHLPGIKKISPSLLKPLARFNGQLELNGIESLSEKEADVLGESPAKGLYLKGIKVLSYDLLKLFTGFTGFLDLSGAHEIKDDFVHIVAARPANFSLYSGAVKRLVDDFKKEQEQKKRDQLRETREIKLKEMERAREADERNRQLLAEFEKFDEIAPIQVEVMGDSPDNEKYDPYSPEIDDSVVNDIEAKLNLEIKDKKKRVEQLVAKGFSNLSTKEKELLQELRDKIEQLKGEIRGTLDILVEKKELGAVVFDSSEDLVAYLKESGAQDDDDDALENIENIDMFGETFEDVDMFGDSAGTEDSEKTDEMVTVSSNNHEDMKSDNQVKAEGDDFIISEV
jgi:hypothetical protein